MPIRDERAYAASEQSRFRDANDRLRAIAVARYGFEPGDHVPFICECADHGCFESVMLSLEEYEHVRSNPSWFVLVAGHEDDEATDERILELERGHVIVEKIGGPAARVPPRAGSGTT